MKVSGKTHVSNLNLHRTSREQTCHKRIPIVNWLLMKLYRSKYSAVQNLRPKPSNIHQQFKGVVEHCSLNRKSLPRKHELGLEDANTKDFMLYRTNKKAHTPGGKVTAQLHIVLWMLKVEASQDECLQKERIIYGTLSLTYKGPFNFGFRQHACPFQGVKIAVFSRRVIFEHSISEHAVLQTSCGYRRKPCGQV